MIHLLLVQVLTTVFPYHSQDIHGIRELELEGGAAIEVITETLSSETDSLSFSCVTEGVRITGDGFSDTLFWLSDPPCEIMRQALMTGTHSLYESRTLEILVLDESCIGGLLRVVSSRDGRTPSEFIAFRTWLYDGTALDLESVVQLDTLFQEVLTSALGIGTVRDVESELWVRGFWLDPQSFLLYKGMETPPLLRLGLPSTEGVDTILVVDIPFSAVNSATGAMMD